MFRFRSCGRPPYCFPQDLGRALVRRTAANTIEMGVAGLLHQDIRRRPSNLHGILPRATFALLHAPLTKGAEGNWQPAYGRYAATFSAVVVSSAWDGRPLTAPRMFEGLGWSMTSYFQDALLTEFEPDIKRTVVHMASSVYSSVSRINVYKLNVLKLGRRDKSAAVGTDGP